MRLFYYACGTVVLCSASLYGVMPYGKSSLFSKKEECRNDITILKQVRAVKECQTKIKKEERKKACGLCTIERSKWAITPKFAVAPTWYTDRGDTLVIDQAAVIGREQIPKFDAMFTLPLMYGGNVGYMFRKGVEFFFDFDYTHAEGRKKFHDYSALGAYLGTRLYMGFFEERLTPFLGLKLGYMHRWPVMMHKREYFRSDNTVAGSVGLGFDFYCNKWVGFSFEMECLVSGQRRSATIENSQITRVGDTGPMVALPFTFGLKFKI